MPFVGLRIRQAESSDKIWRLEPSGCQLRFYPVPFFNNIGLHKKTDLSFRSKSRSSESDRIRRSFILMSKCGGTGLTSYQTCQSVRYRHRRYTDTGTKSGTNAHTGNGGTGIEVVPNLPKCPVPVLMSYRTYQSVRYRYWCRAELTKVSGTGIDVPKLRKCPVPVWMFYRTYRRVRYRHETLYRYRRYRYPYRTELTEVYGTGIDVVPNLPSCPVPVLMCRTCRSVRYR